MAEPKAKKSKRAQSADTVTLPDITPAPLAPDTEPAPKPPAPLKNAPGWLRVVCKRMEATFTANGHPVVRPPSETRVYFVREREDGTEDVVEIDNIHSVGFHHQPGRLSELTVAVYDAEMTVEPDAAKSVRATPEVVAAYADKPEQLRPLNASHVDFLARCRQPRFLELTTSAGIERSGELHDLPDFVDDDGVPHGDDAAAQVLELRRSRIHAWASVVNVEESSRVSLLAHRIDFEHGLR